MENILYKSTEPLWEQRWHLHAPISSWGTLKNKLNNLHPQKPLSWSRVIDDIDMKWTESKENLHRFFDNTNNVHSTIKFTHKTSRTNIWMLTLPVKMIFDIYNKPTDEHQYLSPQSCHPKHCTKSIPYSQALRINRICSIEQTTKKHLGEQKCHRKKRGYNNASIINCFNKASGIDRKDLIQYKEKNSNNRSECHLSSHTILRSVFYPTLFVTTGQPYKNTQNCAKSSKNRPSWLSGNPKL